MVPERVAEIDLSRATSAAEWLLEELEEARDAARARVVVLDASSPLKLPTGLTNEHLVAVMLFELPVVFAFEGAVTGPWTDVALAADIRVAGKGASLQGRLAGNARVRTLADEGTALELFLGRAAVEAPRLLREGLVSTVTAAGAALEEGRRIAGVIASRGPIATRLGKEAIWRGLAQPLEQALRFETDLTLLLQTTKDRAEGVRAFLEKRDPNFTGE